MKLLRNNFKLLVVSGDKVNTDQVGAAFRVQPSADDATGDYQQTFELHAVLSMQGEPDKTGVRAKLQTSMDKEHWIDVVETARLTENATRAQTKPAGGQSLLTWVRAVTELQGVVKPAHTATVWLVSDGPFRCRLE